MVFLNLAKVDVEGSSPFTRSLHHSVGSRINRGSAGFLPPGKYGKKLPNREMAEIPSLPTWTCFGML